MDDTDTIPCQCIGHPLAIEGCVCGPDERLMRAVINGHATLTPERREWCLDEIGQVEGYARKDWEGENDPVLANGVLGAWTDYCRDKGIL